MMQHTTGQATGLTTSQTTGPVTLGVTDPAAIAAFLHPGLPCDDAFWRRVHHRCAQCQEAGTTLNGALWRVSLADDCTNLYYLHVRCVRAYKDAHGLRSVEGRLPRIRSGAVAPTTRPTLPTLEEIVARAPALRALFNEEENR